MKTINRCPVCKRQPKIKRDYNYEALAYGAYCTIICNHLFRKPHKIKVEVGKSTWERAFDIAVDDWNKTTDSLYESEVSL